MSQVSNTPLSAAPPSPEQAIPPRRMTPRRWAFLVLAILAFLIILYVLMNRYTPHTDLAYVQAFVVQIAPGVSGNVIKVYPKENAPIKVGDVLFEIDPLPYQNALKQAEAKLVLAQTEVAQEQEAVQSTKAVVDNAQADLKSAQAMYNAIDALKNTESVSRMDFVTASDRLSARRDALHEAQSSQRRAELQLGALLDNQHASVRAAESEVAIATYQLDQTILKAPADGYITNIQLQVGAYVSAGDKVMTFVDGSSWWMAADFWESSLQLMEPGNRVEFSLQTTPGSTWRGRVESIGWGVMRGQGMPSGQLPSPDDTQAWVRPPQRMPVRIIFDADQSLPPLRVGTSASVTVYTTTYNPLNSVAALFQRIGSLLDYGH